ncbi:hypothetical protein [Janthinobacterium sp. P210005]|uniref:hypothetical protein n=1 Tax=Janthinobacterium sp. P210005 TaxID=3112938 RepID=UPI002E2607E0|nr:hypothetical protein [Janthinobacterium sp. P210005]
MSDDNALGVIAEDDAGAEDDAALATLRWEKGVEFALARELQAWHLESTVPAEALARAKDNKPVGVEGLTEILSRRSRQPRYVPLDGNVEKSLGDALAGLDIGKCVLIECKGSLDDSGWKREAKPQVENPAGSAVKYQNEGGKDRIAKLQRIAGRANVQIRGQQCHFLVGAWKPDETESGAVPGLKFTDYWKFVLGADGSGTAPSIVAMEIAALRDKGLDREQFGEYVLALLTDGDDSMASDEIAWLQRELVLLARVTNTETRETGWIAGRVSESELLRILSLDVRFNALISALEEREQAEKDAKKLRERTKRQEKGKNATRPL